MNRTSSRPFVPAATLALALVMALAVVSGARAQNLIVDGSFEDPALPPGGFNSGFQAFGVGSTFGPGGAWTVVGSSAGNVAVTPDTEFTDFGLGTVNFPAEDQHQWMDLTGNTDNGAVTGIAQSFATTPGALYSLSYWVGDTFDPTYPAPAGGPSTVAVQIDGSPVQTAVNATFPTGPTINWKQFTFLFNAAGPSTTLTFLNGNASGQGLNALDDVSVTAVPSTQAPEPTSLALGAAGLLPFVFYRVRRRV